MAPRDRAARWSECAPTADSGWGIPEHAIRAIRNRRSRSGDASSTASLVDSVDPGLSGVLVRGQVASGRELLIVDLARGRGVPLAEAGGQCGHDLVPAKGQPALQWRDRLLGAA